MIALTVTVSVNLDFVFLVVLIVLFCSGARSSYMLLITSEMI